MGSSSNETESQESYILATSKESNNKYKFHKSLKIMCHGRDAKPQQHVLLV